MKPGRELDAWIHVNVMRRTLPKPLEKGGHPMASIPWYSRDIADAWEVVEKVCCAHKFSREFLLTRTLISRWDEPHKWEYFACFKKDSTDDSAEFSGCADTAPHAICLAAKAAFESTKA
jgi:hypothetical protein